MGRGLIICITFFNIFQFVIF